MDLTKYQEYQKFIDFFKTDKGKLLKHNTKNNLPNIYYWDLLKHHFGLNDKPNRFCFIMVLFSENCSNIKELWDQWYIEDEVYEKGVCVCSHHINCINKLYNIHNGTMLNVGSVCIKNKCFNDDLIIISDFLNNTRKKKSLGKFKPCFRCGKYRISINYDNITRCKTCKNKPIREKLVDVIIKRWPEIKNVGHVLTVGKHSGKTYGYIYNNEPNYVKWVMSIQARGKLKDFQDWVIQQEIVVEEKEESEEDYIFENDNVNIEEVFDIIPVLDKDEVEQESEESEESSENIEILDKEYLEHINNLIKSCV